MPADNGTPSAIPVVVLTYGVLGIVPFLAPSAVGVLLPAFKPTAAQFLVLYGGLILSFLGGRSLGFWPSALPKPSPVVVSAAMIPTLAALALLVFLPGQYRLQVLGLAVALVVHWLWDRAGRNLPAWYPALRSLLTAGALAGLLLGAVVLT